ncbi:MAG: hypothetical protein ABIA37_04750 [Candidatus Woesearchaeota archaeon]
MGVKALTFVLILLLYVISVSAATLHGSIYDLDLKKVDNVLVEINTEPQQQYLAQTGEYTLNVPEGIYLIKAKAGNLSIYEQLRVSAEGDFVFDLFLFPSLEEEDEILADLGIIDDEEKGFFEKYPLWAYLIALGILLIALGRIILAKKRYPRKRSQKNGGVEVEVSVENKEPNYLDEAIRIIKKHEGRITQKEMRKEMMHLSEAKVSLILTELEHKGKVEKIKKGRGNIIILK